MGSKFKQSIQQIEELKKREDCDSCEEGRFNSFDGDEGDGTNGEKDYGSRKRRNQDSASCLQINPIIKTQEAEGRAKILGNLKQKPKSDILDSNRDFCRSEVNPRASPGPIRRDLTISSLIAECEEYCKTDEFTKDFSDHLVHLFSHNRTNSSKLTSDNKSIQENKNISTSAEVVKENSCKPPKIPDNLRTKNINKSEKSERCGKFPVFNAK